jgi:(2Fe-2S) ferredoxin
MPRSRIRAAAKAEAVGVCENKSCRKTGSPETVTMMRALASTHTGIEKMYAAEIAELSAADIQKNFAKLNVEKTGCLGRCGAGPNVVSMTTGQVFRGVHEPALAVAILEEALGLDIPDVAEKAYSKFMEAQKAMKAVRLFPKKNQGKIQEALDLLTSALDEVSTLHAGGALLLYLLFEARGDVYQQMGNVDAAQRDQTCAQYAMSLRYPTGECLESCVLAEHDLGSDGCNPLQFGQDPCQAFCHAVRHAF